MSRYFINFLLLSVCILFTISCGTLFSKVKSDLEGPMSEDVVSKDIDSDMQGSDSGNISGLSTVFFAYDSSDLSRSTKRALRKNARWIKNNSSLSRMELEGHCDSMGSEAYNIGLGLRRAQAAKSFLVSLGVDESKMSIVSYGEEKPISSDNSKNRRVNFVPIY